MLLRIIVVLVLTPQHPVRDTAEAGCSSELVIHFSPVDCTTVAATVSTVFPNFTAFSSSTIRGSLVLVVTSVPFYRTTTESRPTSSKLE